MRRIVIAFEGERLAALNALARRERRDLRAQVAIFIDECLERRGLLMREPMPAIGAAMAQAANTAPACEGVKNVDAH